MLDCHIGLRTLGALAEPRAVVGAEAEHDLGGVLVEVLSSQLHHPTDYLRIGEA